MIDQKLVSFKTFKELQEEVKRLNEEGFKLMVLSHTVLQKGGEAYTGILERIYEKHIDELFRKY